MESILHSFTNTPDGADPAAGLTNVGGTLYGTTSQGGASSYGTVFTITTSGEESVIHSFARGSDGEGPAAGLTNVGSALYGTTQFGGAGGGCSGGCGTVFRITTSGRESVIYSFAGDSDGQNTRASLTYVGGALYGTTKWGGAAGYGTVFKISASGTESVLYSFAGGSDGAFPNGGLTSVGRALYGTTEYGGGASGRGTVFRITTSGTERVVHRFGNPSDGENPVGNLAYVGGALYGTTLDGGASGHGTVFTITASGTESVLYSFAGGSDGAYPNTAPTNVGGTLYGTTMEGGIGGCYSGNGCGTVFSITPSGTESVLYSFAGGSDGEAPAGGLTDVGGVLYGTTQEGGAGGYGTVFSISL